MEAFHLPVVRMGPGLIARDGNFRHDMLNQTLLAEIVQNREEWDVPPSTTADQCWMDGLHVTSAEEVRKQVKAARYPGLSEESWAALQADEQEALIVQLTSGMILSERAQMLSRLVERLQRKVDELQSSLDTSSTSSFTG